MRYLLVASALPCTVLMSCVDSSNNASPGSGDGGTMSDGTTPGRDSSSATDSSSAADSALGADTGPGSDGSATDADSDSGLDAQAWYLVNLADSPALIDVCVSGTQGQFTTLALKAAGLAAVPPHGMSAPFDPGPSDPNTGHRYFRVIDVSADAGTGDGGGPCAAPLVDQSNNLGGGRALIYTNGKRSSFFANAPSYAGTVVPTKDTIVNHDTQQNL